MHYLLKVNEEHYTRGREHYIRNIALDSERFLQRSLYDHKSSISVAFWKSLDVDVRKDYLCLQRSSNKDGQRFFSPSCYESLDWEAVKLITSFEGNILSNVPCFSK